MYAHFQNHFNFKAIVFSRSPLIASVCAEYNITVVDHYETNPFGIPLIRDLFLQSYYLVNSRFYGYVNGDIVLSPVLFTFLTEVERQIHRGEIPANVHFKWLIECRWKLQVASLIQFIKELYLMKVDLIIYPICTIVANMRFFFAIHSVQ